jgi:hypothetical protein
VSNGSRAPQRKVYNEQEYFSVQAAAAVLHRTPRTLRRLEQAGIIPRPKHELPGGRPHQRWYSQTDLAELQRLVTESGFAEDQRGGRGRLKGLLDGLATSPRSAESGKQGSTWSGEHVSRRPRELLHRDDNDDGDEWAPPGERSSRPEPQTSAPLPPPLCCPKCRQEVLWLTTTSANGQAVQTPTCERHGAVDLREPERPDPSKCAECGGHLVWQLQGAQEGFQPVCSACGPVQAPKPAPGRSQPLRGRQEAPQQPWRHEVDFGVGAAATGRLRGLRQGDAVAAIRARKPQAGPKIWIVDPREGPTRPR